MKEIGGYIELDTYTGSEYHPPQNGLNCGRNALAYLFESRKIRKLYIPYYLCGSVSQVCERHDVPYEYYHIDLSFQPLFEANLKEDEYLYIVNYYGQISNQQMLEWQKEYFRIIVDNAQAFFQMPVQGIDTIYSCRKFLGVPDGAYLYTDSILNRELEVDISYDRMRFLLGRYERNAADFYLDYVNNNQFFERETIKKMSRLTHNLLRAIDYNQVKVRRSDNFALLHEIFVHTNELRLSTPEGAFMYPLLLHKGFGIRKILQERKIYIPLLWPDVMNRNDISIGEKHMAEDILPIPCDQRYNEHDIIYISEEIRKCIS